MRNHAGMKLPSTPTPMRDSLAAFDRYQRHFDRWLTPGPSPMMDMINRLSRSEVTRFTDLADKIHRMGSPLGSLATARALSVAGFPSSPVLQTAMDAHNRATRPIFGALERLNGSGNTLWPGQRLIEQMNRLTAMGTAPLDHTATTRMLRRMEQMAALGATGAAPIPAWLRSPGLTGWPRSVDRWMQGTPVAVAAQLWNEQLLQQDVSPEATPEEKVAAASAAGVAAIDEFAATIVRLFEEGQAATAAQIGELDQRMEERQSHTNARLDALERQQRQWLLQPAMLFTIFLALFQMVATPDFLNRYVPQGINAAAHVQQVARQVTMVLAQWFGSIQDDTADLYEVSARPVPFHVRPHGPSRVTRRVAPGQTVLVQARRGPWVLVATYDPRTHQLVTGWCRKKYLHRPKVK